jgi:hypothetical protein
VLLQFPETVVCAFAVQMRGKSLTCRRHIGLDPISPGGSAVQMRGKFLTCRNYDKQISVSDRQTQVEDLKDTEATASQRLAAHLNGRAAGLVGSNPV